MLIISTTGTTVTLQKFSTHIISYVRQKHVTVALQKHQSFQGQGLNPQGQAQRHRHQGQGQGPNLQAESKTRIQSLRTTQGQGPRSRTKVTYNNTAERTQLNQQQS